MKSLFEEFSGTYHREGDYLIPDLIAPEAPQTGIWGMRRREFLRKHHKGIYTGLLLYHGPLVKITRQKTS